MLSLKQETHFAVVPDWSSLATHGQVTQAYHVLDSRKSGFLRPAASAHAPLAAVPKP